MNRSDPSGLDFVDTDKDSGELSWYMQTKAQLGSRDFVMRVPISANLAQSGWVQPSGSRALELSIYGGKISQWQLADLAGKVASAEGWTPGTDIGLLRERLDRIRFVASQMVIPDVVMPDLATMSSPDFQGIANGHAVMASHEAPNMAREMLANGANAFSTEGIESYIMGTAMGARIGRPAAPPRLGGLTRAKPITGPAVEAPEEAEVNRPASPTGPAFVFRMPRAVGADVARVRVRHFTRVSSLDKIEASNRIIASDQNSVFAVRARGRPGSPRDVESEYGIKPGKGGAYVEFDAVLGEFEIVENPITGAREVVFKGDVDLTDRNATYQRNR